MTASTAVRQFPSPNDVDGTWLYRSFANESQHVDDLNTILFGEGVLVLTESLTGVLTGTGDFGDSYTMQYQGLVSHGGGITVRFQGVGTGPANKDWLYDYAGTLAPRWPNGVDQVPAIVGSVVRTAPHASGSAIAQPGKVVSFIAVRQG